MDDTTLARVKRSSAFRRVVAIRYVHKEYSHFMRPVRRALAEQRMLLKNFLEDIGSRGVHSVATRLKSENSAAAAIAGGRFKHLGEVPDMAGMRLVVHSRADVEVVLPFFARQIERRDMAPLSDRLVKHRGYRARHLVVRINGSYRRSRYSVLMEVQIRTLCEDLFATLSRTYWYKNQGAKPTQALRGALLEHVRKAEDIVSEIRGIADAAYSSDPTDLITPHSFIHIVRGTLGETVPVARAVEHVLSLKDGVLTRNEDLQKLFTDSEVQAKVDELNHIEDTLLEEKDTHRGKGALHELYLMVARSPDFDSIKRWIANEAVK